MQLHQIVPVTVVFIAIVMLFDVNFEMLVTKTGDHRSFLYESLADTIAQMIGVGTLSAGDRLPSVRQLSQKRGISVSTVLQAYQALEDRRLIEARPQSGYYVRVQIPDRPTEPAVSSPVMKPCDVAISDLVEEVIISVSDPGLVPFGAAVAGEELLPTSKLNRALARVAREAGPDLNAYIVPQGYLPLRTEIARRSLEWGCALSADDIVITNGCLEALSLCLRAVAKPGDAIVVESPAYFGVLQLIESLGFQALEVSTCPRDGIELDALDEAILCGCVGAVLVTPNFQNPLGFRMPDEKKQRLVEMMSKRHIPIIEDDVYGDLYFTPPRPRSLLAFDKSGTVMSCGSFSKTISPGYRVGWAIPGNSKKEVVHLKLASTVSTASPMQMALLTFLNDGGYERHLRTMRRELMNNLDRLTGSIAEYFPDGTKVTRPTGGFVLWVELPEGMGAIDLHQKALEEGISIAPGPIFSPSDDYDHCIRLNAGHPWTPELDHAIAKLGRLASNLTSQR